MGRKVLVWSSMGIPLPLCTWPLESKQSGDFSPLIFFVLLSPLSTQKEDAWLLVPELELGSRMGQAVLVHGWRVLCISL